MSSLEISEDLSDRIKAMTKDENCSIDNVIYSGLLANVCQRNNNSLDLVKKEIKTAKLPETLEEYIKFLVNFWETLEGLNI